jgi:lysozyme
MRRGSAIPKLILAALALAFLAGCGSRGGVGERASHRAHGVPPAFGDTDPHDWAGWNAPASYPVHGIDASRWQGAIDWSEVARSGVSFAWLKATEGGDIADPHFADHFHGAARAGVPAGAYHFYYLCTPAETQARWFIANVPRRPGALPPVLDIEFNHASPTCRLRPDPSVMRDEILTFQRIVGAHYGARPVIYTTVDFFAANDLGQLRGEEFWLRSVAGHPSEKYPGQRWSFWQYSGTGRVPGVAGDVDLNAFAGSREGWDAWLRQRRL